MSDSNLHLTHLISKFKSSVPPPRHCFIVTHNTVLGRELTLQSLSSNCFDKILFVATESLKYNGPNSDIYEELIVSDLNKLPEEHPQAFAAYRFGFCCIGATKDKLHEEETMEEMALRDQQLIMKITRLAKDNGCQFYCLQSSSIADRDGFFKIAKVRGQTELEASELDFTHLHIYRPAYIKAKSEDRKILPAHEKVAIFLAPVVDLMSSNRFSIAVETAAKAMLMDLVDTAASEAKGEHKAAVKVISNRAMIDFTKIAGRV